MTRLWANQVDRSPLRAMGVVLTSMGALLALGISFGGAARAQTASATQTAQQSSFQVTHLFSVKIPRQVQPAQPQVQGPTPVLGPTATATATAPSATAPPFTVTAKRVFYSVVGCGQPEFTSLPNSPAGNTVRKNKGWLKMVPATNVSLAANFCQPATVTADDEVYVGSQKLQTENKTISSATQWTGTATTTFQGQSFSTTAQAKSSVVFTKFAKLASYYLLQGSLKSEGTVANGHGGYAFGHVALVLEGDASLQTAEIEWGPDLSVSGGAVGVLQDPVTVRVIGTDGKVVRSERLLGTKATVKGGNATFRWKPDGSFEADADEVEWDIDMPSLTLTQRGTAGLSIRKGAVTRRTLSGALQSATVPATTVKPTQTRVVGSIKPTNLHYATPAITAGQKVVLVLGGGGGQLPR